MNIKNRFFVLIIFLIFSTNGCAKEQTEYEDLTAKQCHDQVEKLRIILKNDISPLIELPKEDINKLPSMINEELLDKLDDYSNIMNECQFIVERESVVNTNNSNKEYKHYVLHNQLIKLSTYLNNIKKKKDAGPEFLSLLAKYMRKAYQDLKAELQLNELKGPE